ETGVELEHFRTISGHHQSGVQKSGEGRSAPGHFGDRREDDPVHYLPDLLWGKNSPIGIGAHSAGVWTGVVIKRSLVFLRGIERNGILSVAEYDEADLLTLEELLDDEATAVFQHSWDGGFGFLAAVGDYDALSSGEAIGLQDDREMGQGRQGVCHSVALCV